MNIAKDLAVQSYCFRNFKKNEEVAEKVRAVGLSNLELCAVHADFTDEKSFEKVIGIYAKAGVKIVSIGVQGMNNKPEIEEKFFKFAKMAGARLMSVSFPFSFSLDAFRSAEKLADKYGVNLGIHNHGGRHWLGSAGVLKTVFENTGPRVGLTLDTAWALDAGEDPVKMVEMFAGRLYGLHLKDFVFDRARKPEDVVVGSGNLDLPKLFDVLRKINFNGAAILEYEGDIENPVPAIKKCVEAVKKEAVKIE